MRMTRKTTESLEEEGKWMEVRVWRILPIEKRVSLSLPVLHLHLDRDKSKGKGNKL
jgi:hypothetical protein